MHQDPAPASELDAALRRVQRGVLLTFAVCAVVIAATAAAEAAKPPRGFPIAAVALGVASIIARQVGAAAPARTRVHLALASLLLAAGIGLVGVALALRGGPRGVALAYTLGGAILCLRPPARVAPR